MVSHLLAITPSIGPSHPWGANPSFPQALVDLSLSRAPALRGPTQAPVAAPTPMRQQRPDRSCRLVDASACRTWQPRRPPAIGVILGHASRPPSMGNATPVVKPAASLNKYRTAAATSCGAPKRPAGIRGRRAAPRALLAWLWPASEKLASVIGPSMVPGHTQLTRIFSAAWLSARLRARSTTAPFDAE